MPSWIIVAALLSILATVWLAWLLWRLNAGPQAKRVRGDGGLTIVTGGGGKARHDADAAESGSDGGDGGGGGD